MVKTKSQIASENKIIGVENIFTLEEFIEAVDYGLFNRYDGRGYFHNGEEETELSVWDNTLAWDDVKDYPYVCWYNK